MLCLSLSFYAVGDCTKLANAGARGKLSARVVIAGKSGTTESVARGRAINGKSGISGSGNDSSLGSADGESLSVVIFLHSFDYLIYILQ